MGGILKSAYSNNWMPENIQSKFIRDQISKRYLSNAKDRAYIDSLLDIEFWILNGEENVTHEGLHIPYFSLDHPDQVIKRHKREHYIIMSELMGKAAADAYVRKKEIEATKEKRRWELEDEKQRKEEEREWMITKKRWLKYGGRESASGKILKKRNI